MKEWKGRVKECEPVLLMLLLKCLKKVIEKVEEREHTYTRLEGVDIKTSRTNYYHLLSRSLDRYPCHFATSV